MEHTIGNYIALAVVLVGVFYALKAMKKNRDEKRKANEERRGND